VDRLPPGRREGEALLAVKTVGLCGSDVAAYLGTSPLVTYPRIPGHELCAEILEIDANSRGLAVGDLVCVEPLLSCGECAACRKGKYNCCMMLQVIGVHVDGAMCERFAHRVDRLHQPRSPLTEEQLALCEPLTIGMQACDRGGVSEGQHVVIFGAGAIGLCALAVARTRTEHVLVIDKVPQRLERAKAFGAEVTVNADEAEVGSVVADWTRGDGAEVVIEAVGSPATIEATLDLVGFGGRIAVVGWSKAPVTFNRPHLLLQKEADLVGSRNSREAFPRVLELVESGRVDMLPLVTQRFPLQEAKQAFDLLVNHPEAVGKCLLQVG
jgi:L-gulonate 5-dehydrogenase